MFTTPQAPTGATALLTEATPARWRSAGARLLSAATHWRTLATCTFAWLWSTSLASSAFADQVVQHGGEANLKVPDLSSVQVAGTDGRTLLMGGLLICALGMAFGLAIYKQLKDAPVHRSMLEISELIYATCKTYLLTQFKFILLLEVFIGSIIVYYFGVAQHMEPMRVAIILGFSLVGILGSTGVAWFGIRINTFANSRAAFAALLVKPFPT